MGLLCTYMRMVFIDRMSCIFRTLSELEKAIGGAKGGVDD